MNNSSYTATKIEQAGVNIRWVCFPGPGAAAAGLSDQLNPVAFDHCIGEQLLAHVFDSGFGVGF